MSGSVVDVLNEQHQRLAQLLADVSAPDKDRPAVLHALLRELAAHVAAERAAVQPVVKSRGIGDGLDAELLEDYSRIDKLMVRIERRKFNSPDVPELVAELKEAVDAHIGRADAALVPGLQGTLSAEESRELGDKVTNADSLVVTHPHPHLLSLGGVAGKLTSLLSRFDWMRDRTVTSQPPPSGPGDGGDPSMGGAT